MAFDGLDVAFAQREMFESAVKMGRAALKVIGVEPEEIDRVDFEYRLRDCERLELQSSTGDRAPGLSDPSAPTGTAEGRNLACSVEVGQAAGVDAGLQERLADPPREDQREPAVQVLLVAGHSLDKLGCAVGDPDFGQSGWKPAAAK